jgi:CDP-2,3-bis-(O-geranylgeranyl)-sn-glycerol synthase
MIAFFLTCMYVALPAIVANMLPSLTRNIPFLNIPIDFNKTWNNKPICGDHKTYRGFFFGVLGAIFITYIQSRLYAYPLFQKISFFDYSTTSFWLIGFLIGFGVLFGDLVKSFFKRRVNVKPGDTFFPWDQLDLVIGALVFISFIKIPSWQMVIFYLIVGPLLHIFFNHLGFWLGLQKVKW